MKKLELGTWVQINNSTVVEIIGNSGFDFVVIDLEHSNISLESLENLLRATYQSGLESYVRVNENNPSLISRVLDLGVDGIVFPNVSSVDEAIKIVKASKFPPHGNRGSCPCIREAGHWNLNWAEFIKESNKRVKIIALIEGLKGIENFNEIINVEGIDSYMVGPFDLSVSLGIPGQISHELISDTYKQFAEIANSNGKEFIGLDFSYETDDIAVSIKSWKERNIYKVMTGIDKMFLSKIFSDVANLKNNI
ncbi:HpcH/HpaI aldolase/citrate lyase family protein [Chryseomicrobium aureum]|uniref:HpcH/HpaI aldolase family protein n=1 Tax=Chryseomicrobium aureum TaxID=1441723 RepID=UPI00370DB9A9